MAAFGHVDGDDQPRAAAGRLELERRHLGLEDRAILLAMVEDPTLAVRWQHLERLAHARQLIGGTDLGDGHGQELIAREAVVRDGGLIDVDEAQRLEVVDPHRQRVAVEELAVTLLALAQALLAAAALRYVARRVDHADRIVLCVAHVR